MALADFDVRVVTPDGEVFSGRTTSVVVPGVDGYFGVWRGHAPLIAGMDIGMVLIMGAEDRVVHIIAVSGGFVEVKGGSVTLLAEAAERADDIDTLRADSALTRARDRLSKHFAEIDVERAEVALRKALNRKRAAQRLKERPTSLV
jgi:F-type H+-transporting ATPase subunit epsilon